MVYNVISTFCIGYYILSLIDETHHRVSQALTSAYFNTENVCLNTEKLSILDNMLYHVILSLCYDVI